MSLFKQAQLVEGQNADGWILYRIVRDDGRAATAARVTAA